MQPRSFADFRDLARRRLPGFLFEYVDAGSYAEVTLRRNSADLDSLALRQRVLCDVPAVDTQVEILGQQWSAPVGNPVNAALSRAATAVAEGQSVEAAARGFIDGLRAEPDILAQLARGAVDAGADPAGAGAGGAARAGRTGDDPAAEGGAGAEGRLDGLVPERLPPGNEAARAAHRAAGGTVGPFGPVHPKLAQDWTAAVARLTVDRDGEVPGALFRSDIGAIDLIWGRGGEQGFGLAHILEKHPDVVAKLPDLLSRLPAKRGNTRIILEGEGSRIVLSESFHSHQKRWLVTAFRKGNPGGQTSRRDHLMLDGGSTSTGSILNIGEDAAERNAFEGVPRGFAEFDDPQGPAAAAQADHLMHDLRAAADAEPRAGDGGSAEVDADERDALTGDLFALNAPDEPELKAAIAEIDGDEAAWAAVKACLPGGAQ